MPVVNTGVIAAITVIVAAIHDSIGYVVADTQDTTDIVNIEDITGLAIQNIIDIVNIRGIVGIADIEYITENS
ncbi:hypothetical protein BC008_18065 [Mastigocoleus testarum BC008]|uniref:Uncharacterized protein n=1 Tax=Mastigocoleus testarum BC008 TaxID=371196 RepID=A0A0V7ZIX7_9CYAN|nr:hypothetical protein BC008_18065 [Mastigocoleus testarum BC008]